MKPRIKVLMPKFETLRGISWAKELSLSFVGTIDATRNKIELSPEQKEGDDKLPEAFYILRNGDTYTGRSAHTEAGWFSGQGKKVYVLITDQSSFEPELMYKLFTKVCISLEELINQLN